MFATLDRPSPAPAAARPRGSPAASPRRGAPAAPASRPAPRPVAWAAFLVLCLWMRAAPRTVAGVLGAEGFDAGFDAEFGRGR